MMNEMIRILIVINEKEKKVEKLSEKTCCPQNRGKYRLLDDRQSLGGKVYIRMLMVEFDSSAVSRTSVPVALVEY